MAVFARPGKHAALVVVAPIVMFGLDPRSASGNRLKLSDFAAIHGVTDVSGARVARRPRILAWRNTLPPVHTRPNGDHVIGTVDHMIAVVRRRGQARVIG